MQRRVTFGAVKARLYDAPGATKVTVAEELGKGDISSFFSADSVICTRTKPKKTFARPRDVGALQHLLPLGWGKIFY